MEQYQKYIMIHTIYLSIHICIEFSTHILCWSIVIFVLFYLCYGWIGECICYIVLLSNIAKSKVVGCICPAPRACTFSTRTDRLTRLFKYIWMIDMDRYIFLYVYIGIHWKAHTTSEKKTIFYRCTLKHIGIYKYGHRVLCIWCHAYIVKRKDHDTAHNTQQPFLRTYDVGKFTVVFVHFSYQCKIFLRTDVFQNQQAHSTAPHNAESTRRVPT